MSKDPTDMSTDVAWEEWGRRDPYFGVITNPKFRRNDLSEDAKTEFFKDGETFVNYLLAAIQRNIDPQFRPKRILDFGGGVGRLLVPLLPKKLSDSTFQRRCLKKLGETARSATCAM